MKERQEFKIRRFGTSKVASWQRSSGSNRDLLCGRGTNSTLIIPKEVREAFVVFTSKPTSQNYPIVEYTKVFHWGYGGAERVTCHRLEGYSGSFMCAAQKLLERMYKKGYRYVHIEYDV